MPKFAFIVFLLLTFPSGFANALETPVVKKTLLLNDIDWPPFLFSRENERYIGIGKEIINQCLDEMGYPIDYLKLPVKRTHVQMQNGDLDISLYSYKKAREDFVYYSKVPIFISEYGFAVAKDSKVAINQISDLEKYYIGHLGGLTHTPEVLKIIEDKRKIDEVIESYNIDIMLRQLINVPSRIDIIPNSKETFLWRAKELGISDKIKVLDFTLAVKPYYVTVSKASQNIDRPLQFMGQIDQCLVKLHENGEYEKILDKYGLDAKLYPYEKYILP